MLKVIKGMMRLQQQQAISITEGIIQCIVHVPVLAVPATSTST